LFLFIFPFFFLVTLSNFKYLSYGNDINEAFFQSHNEKSSVHLLKENTKNLFSMDDGRLRINICISVPAYLDYGGIEYWIKSFANIIKKLSNERNIPLKLYGIHVWDLNSYSLIELFKKQNMEYIYRYQDLSVYCDVVINSASWIIRDPNVINIMVIHGDNEDNWTKNYASMHHLNDYVVSVSNFKFNETNPKTSYRYIPTLLLVRDEEPETIRYRYCEKQFLYVGRISEEKRSELICEYVCSKKTPLNTCAVFLGDYYYAENKPSCSCSQVFYLGFRDDVKEFMENSDFLMVPSKSEGGPIVAIEAMKSGIPVIMKKTGLANNFPESFLIFDWDKFDRDTLDFLVDYERNKEAIETVKRNMKKTFEENFSEKFILDSWYSIFSEIYTESFPIYDQIYYSLSESMFSRIRGKRIVLDCWRINCSQKITINSEGDVSFFLSKLNSDKEVTVKISTNYTSDSYVLPSIKEQNPIYFRTNFILPHDKINIEVFANYNNIELWNFKKIIN